MTDPGAKLATRSLSVSYGSKQVLFDVDIDIPAAKITALIGPSGCGKSTLLRAFNRMNDTVPGCSHEGSITLDGTEIYGPELDAVSLRRRVGMVFQKPNPFPKSIFDNVAYGLKISGIRDRATLEGHVEDALRSAALWDEVSDRLGEPALGLSGGQQQRLCIARALAVRPDVLLLDEPTSALDPIATDRIEGLMGELAEQYTLVAVTHNMAQARRVSDRTAFLYLGELIEAGETAQIFDDPQQQRTLEYVQGHFG